jgi:hypothetical protein
MPMSNRRFPRFQPGDRIRAAFMNDLVEAVERLDMCGSAADGLTTGAGVALRVPAPGWRQAVFRLQQSLTRMNTADAEIQQWQDNDWRGRGVLKQLVGDYFRGYGFEDDVVIGIFHPVALKWFAIGSGHFFLRGTLDQALPSSGAVQLSVTTYDSDTLLWSDSLRDVTVTEAVGLKDSSGVDQPLNAGTVVFATWHEQAQLWIASLAACPSTSES